MNSRSKTAQRTFTQVTEKNTSYSMQSKMIKGNENCNPNISNPGLMFSLPLKPEISPVNSASSNTGKVSNSSSWLRKKILERNFKKSTNKKPNSSTVRKSYSGSKDDFNKNRSNADCETKVGDKTEMNSMRSAEKLFGGVPEPGSGRVMYLVKEFEKLLVRNLENFEGKKVVKGDRKSSSSSLSPMEHCMTSENLGLGSRHSFSLQSSHGSSTTPAGCHRRRHSSAELSETTSGRRWGKKQLKATSPRPFRLRTEQRGRNKEEEFTKKLHQMLEEEEKLRVPIAQGLPWTIDEPECLVKPPVKETTRPVDLVLHTDSRSAERAEFDHQVAEKMIMIEHDKIERERKQKLEEEEEIRRLRKALVPKAQPMPYFDRPFVPTRSSKKRTVPNEPKSHARHQHKESLNGGSG